MRLNLKTRGCTLPVCVASSPFSITADALPLPPKTTRPPAGTTTGPEPSAGFSCTEPLLPVRVMESRVSALEPVLNTVADTTAGPLASRSGWVMTLTFWILIVPAEVAALSGLTSSVCALLPAPHAVSAVNENAMAVAARAPCRRLRLTAAATP